MGKRLSAETVQEIKTLRSQGLSISEIKTKVQIGYGTVSRYIQQVEILPEYRKIWLAKRNSSITRMNLEEKNARKKAISLVNTLNAKERLLILSSLYWAEGNKRDLSFTNSDPDMVAYFINTLIDVLHIPKEQIRINIRVYEDMNIKECETFWINKTNLKTRNLGNTNILVGKKMGKLKYGMCRIRVLKGGSVLKYLTAIKQQMTEISSL